MELKAVNLTKKYDNGKGIQDTNFQMHEGIYALLGPNGAGKSTLIRVLTGLQKMSSGQVLWNHQDTKVLGRHFCEKIGYAPQSVTLYNSLLLWILCFFVKEQEDKNWYYIRLTHHDLYWNGNYGICDYLFSCRENKK